ncbi:MAG: SLC13 family permease, partial [Phycisphaerales bacterium]|nr:SLC13 family permease [Phycisphaerales bacterium]
MGYEAAIVLTSLSLVLALMIFTRIAPATIMMGGLTLIMVSPVRSDDGWRIGVLSAEKALAGFSNTGLFTVGILFVVVCGLRTTGAVDWIASAILGRPTTLRRGLLRLITPVAALSAFLNNTPVVAMMIPAVQDWSRRLGIAGSRLLMPLSYAAILGGTCTIIGTSTNLVVQGLVIATPGLDPLGFFEIAAIGVPTAIVGVLFVTTAGRWLLPDRSPPLARTEETREYALEMLVDPASPLIGQDLERAGLRHLPGAFLAEIQRDGGVLPAVAPTERIVAGDRSLFVGAVDSVADLLRIRGLVPAPEQLFKLDAPRPERRILEAVVA